MTPDEAKAELEQRISDAAGLRFMIETPGWQLARLWLDDTLTTYDEALKSKEFVDDHNGYLNARALYVSSKNFLDFIEGTIEDGERAKRELDEFDQPIGL